MIDSDECLHMQVCRDLICTGWRLWAHLNGANRLAIVSNDDKGREPLVSHRLAAIALLQPEAQLQHKALQIFPSASRAGLQRRHPIALTMRFCLQKTNPFEVLSNTRTVAIIKSCVHV